MPPYSTPSEPDDLIATVKQTLATHHMLTAGDRVLVGVSGGPDSMALLHLLGRLAPELKVRLGVAHINHGLRGASADRDAELVRLTAVALGYPCHVRRANTFTVKRKLGLCLEEAARRVRYAFFQQTMIASGYNKLALGHHMNDNAEQVLMALLRGAGPQGLSGITPVRDNRIVRPLINVRRSQIEAFVTKAGISSVTDESNADLRYTRNRIRHHLLPLLAAQYNPRIDVHLHRLAEVMRTEAAWIEALTAVPYDESVLERGGCAITLSVDSLRQAHPALGRRLIRKALKDLTGTLRRFGFCHVQAVLNLLTGSGGEKVCHLPGGVRALRSTDQLILSMTTRARRRSAGKGINKQTTEINGPFPAIVEMQTVGIGLRFTLCRPRQMPAWKDVGHDRAFLDLQQLSFPLTVRSVVPGDRFTPLGASGSQKLKKFFIDHKISRRARSMSVVLADRRRIVWLVGQRIDDYVKVTEKTTQVLRVEFYLLDTR